MTDWELEQLARRVTAFTERIPPAYRVPGELMPQVRAWSRMLVDGAAGNLALLGGVGAGKTWQVWRALLEAVRAGYTQRIVVLSPGQWRNLVAPDEQRAARLRAVFDAGVVVFDDLAAHRVTDWQTEALYDVLAHRWEWATPTVITSNEANLRGVLGERAASRFAHRCTVVTVTGPDLRRTR